VNKSIETFKSQAFIQNDLQLFVNRASESFQSPLHNHDFIELAYIAEGAGFHYVNDTVYRVLSGELFFIPIGVPHVFRPISPDASKHPLVVFNCVFKPDLLQTLAYFCQERDTSQFIEALMSDTAACFFLMDEDGALAKIFQTMHREFSLPQKGSTDCLTALLLQLLIFMQRRTANERIPLQVNQLAGFEQLLGYVEQHITDDLTLTRLAQISLWSERHIQRLFLKHTEQTFIQYLQSLRIQKSRELLRSSQHKVTAVAEMVGYKDSGYFLTVFKRITGMTPSQYRKSLS